MIKLKTGCLTALGLTASGFTALEFAQLRDARHTPAILQFSGRRQILLQMLCGL